jgi:hypothetical protein
MKRLLSAGKISSLFPFLSFGSPKEKLSFSQAAKEKLGLSGLEGEDLIQALIVAYKNGYHVDVYQALLNVQVDCDSFYELQGEAWGYALRVKRLKKLEDKNEQMVRAIAHMAMDRMGK